MKESIANSVLFYIVIIFVALFIGVLTMSLTYSKAFKVKNRIVEMIERHPGYDRELEAEIDDMLGTLGYRINDYYLNNCPIRPNAVDMYGNVTGRAINESSKYRYCIYKYDTLKGSYYGVITYMYFDIPLVENLVLPVYSETKILFDLSTY